jgi:D-sedoheptulose 7-phosphate isomerase
MAANVETYFAALKNTLDSLDREAILRFLAVLLRAREEGRSVFVMGNGGSAATASHFVCDFNKGLRREEGKNFRFLCLNDNVPSMMAVANDVSYDAVFVEQLKSYLAPGDVVMGISGSGNSANVVNALEYARAHGAETVAFVGYDGGRMKDLARHAVHVPLRDMQIVEDIHMVLDHLSMRVLSLHDHGEGIENNGRTPTCRKK